MFPLYTAGYSGIPSPEHLRDWCKAHDNATLMDIRFSPRSQQPGWDGNALRSLFGIDYTHIRAFGNKNYNNDLPIALADPDAGLAAARISLNIAPVVLLCGCRDHRHCHRLVAADFIADRLGVAVTHLYRSDFEPPKPPKPRQLPLF